jgi:hypothetical protein
MTSNLNKMIEQWKRSNQREYDELPKNMRADLGARNGWKGYAPKGTRRQAQSYSKARTEVQQINGPR